MYEEFELDEWEKRNFKLRQRDMQLELWKQEVKNGMEIQKKNAISSMSISRSIQRAEALADVASMRELQRTLISFSAGGEVILQKECFGEGISGKLPIKIIAVRQFCHLMDTENRALSVLVQKENGEKCNLFWNPEKNENRWIRSVFEKNGISFGFGEKKENEIRRKILLALMEVAEIVVLPERHGWYQVGEKWEYAFPDDFTWEEVNREC